MNDEQDPTTKKERNAVTKVVDRRAFGGDADVLDTFIVNLEVLGGPGKGQRFRISKQETIIGRGEDADITIDDESASRRHAAILFRDLEFRIKDLDSSNGTFLNGSEVKEYALRNGDKIIVGETMFQFTITR